jgi:two-component system NtrC family sensor kinase
MPRLGLRTKFFLYSNTLIVVTMALVTILLIFHERRTRYEAIERRGRSICEVMAIPITDALMYEDLDLILETGLIENYISEIQARNRDLMRYVVVTDTAGRVTHSSDWDLLGETFHRALDASTADGATVLERLDQGGELPILEGRIPLAISTKSWGTLVVGFSLEPIEAQVRVIAMQAALVALLLMIGNSALTAIYVETLIRPILALNRTMKRAARGDLSVRALSRAGAEVRELAAAFNRMMDEIEESRERARVQQAQLVHTEKMVAVGTLAAGVAHEVNNPLSGILTCIESMRAHPDDRAMQERYLKLIHDGLRRIEHTVVSLLDFSRERALELAPTSVNHSLRHVVELATYQLRVGHVEVVFELDADEPLIMGDSFQVDQLFLNLVLNARQAMPAGGKLTLRSIRRPGRVVVEVRDTGVGIPEDALDRIFNPFFTTREVGEGTGLGLTVSDSIVSSHGGTLEVESRVGQGSVFRVSFPMLTLRASRENAS